MRKKDFLHSLSSLGVSHPGPPPPVVIYYLSTMVQQRGRRFTMVPCKEDHTLLRLELPLGLRIVIIKQLRYFHSVFSLHPVNREEERPQKASEGVRFGWRGWRGCGAWNAPEGVNHCLNGHYGL
jgi:hypothetical protein